MNDQEKRELMIKAAVKFEGKWPEGATLLYRLGEKITAAKDNGDLNPVEVTSKPGVSYFLMVGVDAWQPFCNQQEFEAFMDGLAVKAPEGAEYYSPKDGSFVECWFKFFNNEWMFSIWKNHTWHKISPQAVVGERKLIPLPKREPALWTPEVGQECEYTTTEYQESKPSIKVGEWYRAKVIAYHDDFVWTSDNGLRMLSTTKFRPIRTDAEIARQALYDSLCELDADLDDYQINRLIEFIQGRKHD